MAAKMTHPKGSDFIKDEQMRTIGTNINNNNSNFNNNSHDEEVGENPNFGIINDLRKSSPTVTPDFIKIPCSPGRGEGTSPDPPPPLVPPDEGTSLHFPHNHLNSEEILSDQNGTLDLSVGRGTGCSASSRIHSPKIHLPNCGNSNPSRFGNSCLQSLSGGMLLGSGIQYGLFPPQEPGSEAMGMNRLALDSSLYAGNLPPHLLPWLISSQLNSVAHQVTELTLLKTINLRINY